MRLEDLEEWIKAWALPEMYAGVEAQGAEDAAYHIALVAELCKFTHTDFSGGAADA